jgi:hypothetical protein
MAVLHTGGIRKLDNFQNKADIEAVNGMTGIMQQHD